MISVGTFILCCACFLFLGIIIGDSKRQEEVLKEFDDLKNFYHENTKTLVAYIAKLKETHAVHAVPYDDFDLLQVQVERLTAERDRLQGMLDDFLKDEEIHND